MDRKVEKTFKEKKEEWTQWRSIKNLSPNIYIESISDNVNEFTILYSGATSKEIIKISLDHSPISYRTADESYRLRTMCYPKFSLSKGRFFKIKNSIYISWLLEESYEIDNNLNLMHFAIFGTDIIVDIIDTFEPKIEIL